MVPADPTEAAAPDAPKASVGARAAGGALWALIEGAVAQIAAFGSFLVIARHVGPEAIGLLVAVIAAVEVVRTVALDPWGVALTADAEAGEERWRGGFWTALALGAGLFSLALALSPFLAASIGVPEAGPFAQALSATLLIHAAGRIAEASLVRHMRFRMLAARSAISGIAGATAGITAALAGFGVWALVLQQLVMSACAAAIALAAARLPLRGPLDRADIAAHARRAAGLAPNALGHVLAQNVDVFAVSFAGGPATMGLYALARRVRLAAQLSVAGFGRVALGTLSSLAPDRRADTLVQGSALTLLCAGPAFVGLAAISDRLVPLVFGEAWRAAAPALALLALSGPFLLMCDFLEQALIVAGRLRALGAAKLAYAGLLAASLLGLSPFGATAAAGGALACAAALWATLTVIAARADALPLGAYLFALARPAAASAAMAAAVAVSGVGLAPAIALGAAVYPGAAWVLARPSIDRLRGVAALIVTPRLKRLWRR